MKTSKTKRFRLIALRSQQEEVLRELCSMRAGDIQISEPDENALELGLGHQPSELEPWQIEIPADLAEIAEAKRRLKLLEAERAELIALIKEKEGNNALVLPGKMVDAAEKSLYTKNTFVLDAYLDARQEKALVEMLSKFGCAWEIEGAAKEKEKRGGFFARLWRRI